jgi:hypothetical protein
MAYKPTAGDRNEALGGFERDSGFQTCNDCLDQESCKAAGRCALDAFSPKNTFDRVNKGKGFK